MAQRGRPPKQPVTNRIQDALGAAQEEIDKKLPVEIQQALVPEIITPDVVTVPPAKISKDAQDDYDFARSNLHALLLKGNEILEGISELARESEHPRTYEVAGGVLKTLIDGTRELMQLQKDIRDVEKKSGIAPDDVNTPVHVEHADQINNVILEGTTMDVLDILDAAKKKRAEKKEIEN